MRFAIFALFLCLFVVVCIDGVDGLFGGIFEWIHGWGKKQKLPIIFVHGITGSKIFVEGNDIPFPVGLSQCQSNWSRMKAWISPWLGSVGLFKQQGCLLWLLSLRYDPVKQKFYDQTNVKVTVGDYSETTSKFGSIWPVICLLSESLTFLGAGGCAASAGLNSADAQIFPFAWHFANRHGYELNENILAAPYDWRRTADMEDMDAYFDNLKKLVEVTSKRYNQKVMIMAHSMGNLITNYWLNNRVDEEWQKKYINATINVSAPWGGASAIIEMMLSGNAAHMSPFAPLLLSDRTIRDFVRTLPSMAALLPSKLAFPEGQRLVFYNSKNYHTGNMDELLALANSSHLLATYRKMTAAVQPNKYTPMYCIHSNQNTNHGAWLPFLWSKKPTPETPLSFSYLLGLDKPLAINKGEGDGSVNIESLRVCNEWKNQGKNVKDVVEIVGPTHTGILADDAFYKAVGKILGF